MGQRLLFGAADVGEVAGQQPFFVVQGTKGEIVLDGFAGGGRVYTMGASGMECADINAGWEGPVGWETGYAGELEDFAAACVEGRPPQATPPFCAARTSLHIASWRF